ncbi:DUF4179 domain-containing protein [Bacillus marasmi]|uniref:DUF4179 domain-containing protein n=1 Tax=Bacillus marasmi TaxID=1926279 RepID=UPI0011CA0CFD|nr:DUF4179 domain-containing protein [Bacillus marasmi]
MNNKNQDVKEAIEKIEVPIEKLDNAIQLAIKRAKTKKKKYPRKWYRLTGAVSLAAFVFIGSAFVSPTMAKVLSNVPLLDSVFEFVGDRGLETASQKGLSNKINQTVTDKDITLTIKDIFYDGTRLSISYIQEFPDQLDDLGELELKVDGKEINFADSRTGELVSDHQYAGIVNIKPTEELPDSFELSIKLKEIGGVKGAWSYNIPVKKSKGDVKTIHINNTSVYKDTTITVKTVKVGPAGIKLSVDLSSAKGDKELIMKNLLKFNLIDDQGVGLTHLDETGSGGEVGGKIVMNMDYTFAPLESDTEFLTISPFLMPDSFEVLPRVEQPLQVDALPLTLDQGKMGKIKIYDVKYQEEKTLLYFEVLSDFPYDGHFQYNYLFLEDGEGNDLTSDAKAYPERIKPNTYVQEFKKINKNEPIKVVTFEMPALKILKELEIKMPIK